MIPPRIHHLLDRLRTRDRLLALARNLGAAATVVVAALLLAGFTDWLVDLWIDTPLWLRGTLFSLQFAAWFAALGLLVLPLLKRYQYDDLALWIERRVPLGQRLIAAVQLNRENADTRGMSRDLIAAVTRQAEQQSDRVTLTDVCDNARLKQGACWLAPAVLLPLLLLLSAPATCSALVTRLFGGEADIPRSVRLEPGEEEVWPAGEEGVLRVFVPGRPPGSKARGLVRIQPEVGSAFRALLSHAEDTEDGAIFTAKVPPGDGAFTYRSWLADGRSRRPGQVRYAPRPVATSVQAWVMLPVRLGKKDDGSPYEEAQKGGDIAYQLPDAHARILVSAQTELSTAEVVIRGKNERTLPLAIEGTQAAGTWDLREGDATYEVRMVSADKLEAIDLPRRAIRRVPLQPPEVALMAETFWREGDSGSPEDREVEGIPILRTQDPKVGRRFRLDYRCEARYGLSHVRLRFRVIPAGKELEAEAGKIDTSKFLTLPLGPPRSGKGPITDQARREFSTLPARDANTLPDLEGKGRYDFSIDGIPDGKGGYVEMKEGDRIQFFVEVFGKADPDGVPGRSVVREKEVVGPAAYLSWLEKKDDLKERTRFLEEQQRSVKPGGGGGQ